MPSNALKQASGQRGRAVLALDYARRAERAPCLADKLGSSVMRSQWKQSPNPS